MDTKKLMKLETGPFPLFRQFARDFDVLLDRVGFDRFKALDVAQPFWMPDVEVIERGGEFIVRADVPGMKKDDITIEIADKELHIRGERKHEQEEKGEGFYRSERAYGEFFRTIPLPEGVTIDKAKALVRDGVLEVTMPIVKIEQKTRRIEIQSPAAGEKVGKHAA